MLPQISLQYDTASQLTQNHCVLENLRRDYSFSTSTLNVVVLHYQYHLRLHELWVSHLVTCLLLAICLIRSLFCPEDWGSRFPRNIGRRFSYYAHRIPEDNDLEHNFCILMFPDAISVKYNSMLVNIFTAFYGTWWLITAFAITHRWSRARLMVPKLFGPLILPYKTAFSNYFLMRYVGLIKWYQFPNVWSKATPTVNKVTTHRRLPLPPPLLLAPH
jgi:hypothetical protein